MLNIQKKFSPKNRLLQSNLEQFLYWRFQAKQLKPFSNVTTSPTTPLRLNTGLVDRKQNFLQSSFYKPGIFENSFENNTRIDTEPFFPQKKPFMQFWTLPLLGASVLSFLTFQTGETSSVSPAVASFSTLKETNNQKFTVSKSNETEVFMKKNSANEASISKPFIAKEPSVPMEFLQTNYVLSKNNLWEQNDATQLEKLCAFYLNLTQEHLTPSFSTTAQEFTLLKKEVPDFLANLLNFQKSQLNFYTDKLYSQPLISSTNHTKLNSRVFGQKLNPGMVDLTPSGLAANSMNWKTKPILSYLESVQLFEQWFKTGYFQTGRSNSNLPSLNLKDWHEKGAAYYFNFLEKEENVNTGLQNQSLETQQRFQAFRNLLKTIAEQKNTCAKSYSNLKATTSVTPNSKNEQEQIQEVGIQDENRIKFHQDLSSYFGKKYKFSLDTLVTRYADAKVPRFWKTNNHFLKTRAVLKFSPKTNKQKLKELFTRHVKKQSQQKEMQSLLNTRNSVAAKKNIEEVFYQSAILKRLKNGTLQSPSLGQTSLSRVKNTEKFIQETTLYAQLKSIQNKLNQNFNLVFENPNFPLLKSKSVFYTAKSLTKPRSNELVKPVEHFLEMQSFETNLKDNIVIFNPAVHKNKPFLTLNSHSVDTWASYRNLLAKIETLFPNLSPLFYQGNPNLIRETAAFALQQNVLKFKKNSYLGIKGPVFEGTSGGDFTGKARLFKPHSASKSSILKTGKKKEILKSNSLKTFNSRQTEKVFRTYLSVKNSRGLENNSKATNWIDLKRRSEKQKFLESVKILKRKTKMFSKVKTQMPQSYKKVFVKNKSGDTFKQSTTGFNGKVGLQFNPTGVFLKEFQEFSFLKKGDFEPSLTTTKIFERKKALEKKRRFKKLKLENRRRKKRKRLYPRPHFLRFQLYTNFLHKRYGVSKLAAPTASAVLNPKYLNHPSVNYTSLSQEIYGQSQRGFQNNGMDQDQFFSTLRQKEFYKISNQTLTEFERLCWKSYWLRSNLKPYILKIQKSLKQIKKYENFKTSDKTFSGILSSFSTQILNTKTNLYQPSLSASTAGTNTQNTMYSKRAYLNISENLKQPFNTSMANSALNSSKPSLGSKLNRREFNSYNSGRNLFANAVKKAEYERLLYERMNDEIKNVKSQLNVEGQSQARSYKPGRQKIERMSTNPFWHGPFAFATNYLEPSLTSAYGFKGSPFTRTQLSGQDLPTLRVLWACQKSHLFTYKPNNTAQNLWTVYKQREQRKNNQTRKFFYRLSRKLENFQDWFNYSSKSETLGAEKSNLPNLSDAAEFSDGKKEFEIVKNALKNKKLQNLSVAKTNWVNKKVQTFGGFLTAKNYKPYLKTLKWQLQKTPLSKLEQLNGEKRNQAGLADPKSLVNNVFDRGPWFETNMGNFMQKRAFHFGWSLGNTQTEFPFLLGSPFLFNNPENIYSSGNWEGSLNGSTLFPRSSTSEKTLSLESQAVLQAFWVCAVIFHVGIFFSLLRIPEIRSLMKFQILVLSKLCNAYLFGIFAIYDLFKNYVSKLQALSQKLWFVSNGTHPIATSPEVFTSPLKLKTQDFLKSQTRLNSKVTIQRTLYWNFSYKLFFTQQFKELSKVAQKDADFLLHQTTFSSAYGTSPLNKNSYKSYVSWSTGFFWTLFMKNFDTSAFLKQKKIFQNQANQNLNIKEKGLRGVGMQTASKKEMSKKELSYALQTNIQIQSFLSLSILATTRAAFSLFYVCLNLFYKCLFQVIDLLEGTLFIFYKFLEKPAEVVVDWIAEVFLIEWTSDVSSYVPEAFDTSLWTSVTKASRTTRFFYGLPLGFGMQRFVLQSAQIFYGWILKPDADLISRQKKGIIFWDIWSEILIQAAEQYKMNLSSLSTVKDEQELLMENLLGKKPTPAETSTSSTGFSSRAKTPRKSDKTGTDDVNANALDKRNRTSQVFSASKKGSIKAEGSPAFLKKEEKIDFLNQANFHKSFQKLEPLLKFIQTSPKFVNLENRSEKQVLFGVGTSASETDFSLFSTPAKYRVSSKSLPEVNSVNLARFKVDNGLSLNHFNQRSLNRWSVSQYLNMQGKDTDLFMDIHPPKSFNHVSFLKTYLPAQEILGSLVCEIYAGLFASKVSKNVLIVGAPGMAKSFFIQALVGETELKMVLDNAHRYAFVNGGVPVGMKLLREVFDSIALHTPCLFLLEDVHVIGERRPMLISDDETSKTKETAFGAEQEEVHEKNKLVYQLSKHALSHYKKPYKGDFSLSIPTNHFCYDLFLGVLPPRKRRSGMSAPSPLPVQQLENNLITGGTGLPASNSGFGSDPRNAQESLGQGLAPKTLLSALQISSSQVFAPPATSPFHVLLMKEQKKLKPKKLIKDVPWSGLSYDQWMLLSKNNYSVRVKVALLAETAMKNLSVKLDMITDLLVIIDSVRSNRGFVVFATTHVPALLDPALRRPGRLDETIALPLLPNIQTRFEIFKTRLCSYAESIDFFDWSVYSGQKKQNENELASFLNKHILLLLNSKRTTNANWLQNPARKAEQTKGLNINLYSPDSTSQVFTRPSFVQDYPIYSLNQAFQSSMQLQSLWINPSNLKKMLKNNVEPDVQLSEAVGGLSPRTPDLFRKSLGKSMFAGTDQTNFVALSYAQSGQFFIEALVLKDQTTYTAKFVANLNVDEFSKVDRQKFMYQTLYSSTLETKQTLFKLFAGKLAQFFVFQAFNPALRSVSGVARESSGKSKTNNVKLEFSGRGFSFFDLVTNPSQRSNFNNLYNSVNYWQDATGFLDALFQKRYLYNKNSIVLKMLFFEDKVILNEPPSPPSSSILMPARRFENYKRTLRDFIQKPGLNINQKLQMHQKQRFLKLLYNIAVQNVFQGSGAPTSSSEQELRGDGSSPRDQTSFYNSFKDLGYLDLVALRPSSAYGVYHKTVLTKQRFSFLNQWWNAQLAEHTAETTYLSHIDWRSIFVPGLGDVFLDFPDAEQYYNPRQRRWFLQSKEWSYWTNFETDQRQKISEHFLMECFTKTSELFHANREMLDYLAYRFLRNHELHELDLLQVLVRFYKHNGI